MVGRERIKMAVTLVPFPVRAAEAAGVAPAQMRGARGMPSCPST